MKIASILFVFFLFITDSFAQSPLLSSGPMPGFSDMKRVLIWVQTTEAASIKYQYKIKGSDESWKMSPEVSTHQETGFTAKVMIDSLTPGTWYEYRLIINNEIVKLNRELRFKTQAHWQYRTDPPPFIMATGSCAYMNEPNDDRPGTPYGSEYQIFNSIYKLKPEFMLWLGDNVYYREPDWYTKAGMIHRYTHSRAIPELQPMLGSMHHYAIWDDHDYGPNDSDRGWFLKDSSLDVFEMFWGNPTFGLHDIPGAISYFQWSDIDFFLLDNRYYRSPNDRKTGEKTILGEAQKEWLIDALSYSHAPYKVVAMGGQFLNTLNAYETYSNYGFEKERQEIIDLIYAENIKGVIFLSGDRHHSELSVLKAEGRPTIYDFTVSSLTAGVHKEGASEVNDLRVQGSMVVQHNFGTLEFTGPRKDRVLTLRLHDVDGNVVFTHEIHQADL